MGSIAGNPYRRSLRAAGIAIACFAATFGYGEARAADSGTLSVTLTTESVGISISGQALAFGGPRAVGVSLVAHPQPGAGVAPYLAAPIITNTGNVNIQFISVSYTGSTGQEAACGEGSWSAHQSTAGIDRFAIRVLATSTNTWSAFNSGARYIDPGSGTSDILSSTLSPAGTINMPLQFFMPTALVNGTGACAIGLAVTASSSES
jgi:hypothetical protein